jgi:Mor family transcriptional regulator
MPKARDNLLVNDLILSCSRGGVSPQAAQKAIRALCRHYGGQMLYIPAKKDDGASAENLRSVLADAVGGSDAEKILSRIMGLYGNMQLYFPLERTAFRKTIALEIFARCGSGGCTMNDLAREYGISAMHGYRLWRIGQQEKLKPSMPFLPFLELAENNNCD